MEPRRYTKEPILTVERTDCISLFLFYGPNIIRSGLVTIGKPELISKVVISRAIGVVRSLESKLFKEYILIDAVYTLDSTLVFYYTTKLPELGFPSIYILYTWHLRKEVA